MSDQSPLAPPPLPPVRRLTRAVWIAAALAVCITVFVVLFLAGPRRGATAALPAARTLSGSDPGFLQHPAGELAPTAVVPSEEEYVRNLLARQGAQGAAGGAGYGAAGGASESGRGPNAVSDRRRDAFERALAAPLSRTPAVKAPSSGAETADLPRWLAAIEGSPERAAAAQKALAAVAGARAAGPGEAMSGGGWVPGVGRAAGDFDAGSAAPRAGVAAPGAAGEPRAAAAVAADRSLPGLGTGAGAGRQGGIAVRFHGRPASTTLPAGTVVPALLLTEVNSDLPGNLLAQVSRDVYDYRQEVVLIPSGTRLLGRYDSQVALGQSRLLVAWTRVVLPDGSGFDLPGLPATDAGGAAGLPAQVNRHLGRVFGDALLLSLLSAGAQLSQPQPTGFGTAPSAGNVAAAALGQELSSVGLELLHRDIAIQPTLRLPAATPLLVFVNGDIDLAPLFAAGGFHGPR